VKRLLVLVLLLAGCSAQQVVPPPETGPFENCSALASGRSELPSLTLPCFSDGSSVQIGQIGGPSIVNIWASWCGPCREELPAFQRLADKKTITVVGVATDDRREAAASLANDLGVRLPALFDADGALRRELGEIGLPLTLFIDAQGKVTRYNGPALTDETLAKLVSERLGIA
jgi:cytochrome c biogenesis protein CcmG/thiol:disulfide interchange protein DsbE